MKLSVATTDLQRALGNVMLVISQRVTDSIFLNVQIEAVAGWLILRATDTIATVSVRIPAEVEDGGCLGVNAQKLHKIVSNAPDVEKLKLRQKDQALFIRAKRSKSKLVTVPGDSFPVWSKPPSPGAVLPSSEVQRCLRWVRHSLIDDANRAGLSGVRMTVESNTYITMSTCDARRLARTGVLVDDTSGDLTVFLPTRAAKVLMKFCDWTKGPFNLCVASNEVFFWNADGLGYSCKLMKATGVDPEAIRPIGSPKTMATFDRLKMLEALQRVRAIEDREILFRYDPKGIRLHATNKDGEAEELIPVALTGNAAEVTLSGEHMRDSLAAMKSKEVYLYVWELHKPMMLVPAGDEETFELIMPMNG